MQVLRGHTILRSLSMGTPCMSSILCCKLQVVCGLLVDKERNIVRQSQIYLACWTKKEIMRNSKDGYIHINIYVCIYMSGSHYD